MNQETDNRPKEPSEIDKELIVQKDNYKFFQKSLFLNQIFIMRFPSERELYQQVTGG